MSASRFPPIAIVGRACVLPGALSPEQLWDRVATGTDAVSSVDPGRWRADPQDVMCPPDEPAPDHTWSDRGGYVRGFEQIWDPEGFGVPADELAGLDPLVHWVLHCAREALADAGDARRGDVSRPRVGAVFGNLGFPTAAMSRYAESQWFDAPPGTDPRNRFMCGGTAATLERGLGLAPGVFCLDTACASSLYAIDLACTQLHEGRVDLALAGAVNRADDLFLHLGFAALNALSRSGQSRPFHAQADGLLPAEGAGFVALRRLADARRDGDHIYGVIRGIGLSNDGRGRGLLVPSESGQRRALRQAYERAGLDPAAVSLLECHATGTTVGDTTELRSSAAIFAEAPSLPIGSLKSNIGHAITAAGVAGLIKVLEALHHRQRPPSLHTNALNPALAETPLRVVQALEPWTTPDDTTPRIAGVSAFGFGGNNAHLVVGDDHPSIEAMTSAPTEPQPLAIVGLGVVAGEATGVPALERSLLAGESLVREGGAATGPYALALAGMRVPPHDLRHALAQQLLLLWAAREATESLSLPHEQTGVFIGMEPDAEICRHGARARVATRLRESGGDPHTEQAWVDATRDAICEPMVAATVVGTMPNIPANRINVLLDLVGPSWTVSAGEASGLRALELARGALDRRQLEVAIVGATDLSCEEIHRAALRTIDGVDAPAGDAAVVLVLRRLADARTRGDTILGVIEPPGAAEAPSLTPGQDDFGLRTRLGRCWAAGELRDLAAALIAGRRGALPDGRAWPHPATDPRMHITAGPGRPGFDLLPVPARPQLVAFAGDDPSALDQALSRGELGGRGPSRAVLLAHGPAVLDERVARAQRHLRHGAPAGRGVFVRRTPVRGALAFVFGGAGAAYAGMGEELFTALPHLREQVAQAHPELATYFQRPWPATEADVPPLQRLWSTSFVAQAHARLSTELLGLQPDAFIGYSSGESNALFAAGIWSDLDAMVRACRESDVFTRDIGGEHRAVAQAWDTDDVDWETWTVLGPIDALHAAARDEPRAHVSIVHHAGEGVLAGDRLACARIRERLAGARWLRLHYDLAVHVPELRRIAEPWLALHRRPVTPRPDLWIYSAAHAAVYEPSIEACAQAILGQAERPIDFRAVIEQAYADGVRVFVEHGPRAACSRWIREILGDRQEQVVVVALDRPGGGVESVLQAIAALQAAGVECDHQRLEAVLARTPEHASGPQLDFVAHPRPVRVPPAPHHSPRSQPLDPTMQDRRPVQVMAPAPTLPPTDTTTMDVAPPLPTTAEPAASVTTATRPADAHPMASMIPAEVFSPAGHRHSHPMAAVVQAGVAALGHQHRAFIEQQAAQHQRFVRLHEQGMATLVAAAQQGMVSAPAAQPTVVAPPPPAPADPISSSGPATRTNAPAPVAEPTIVPRTTTPVRAPAAQATNPAKATTPDPVRRPAAAKPPNAKPQPERRPPRPPIGPTFSREQLEILAGQRISEVFGPEFAGQDDFHRQVRMPMPPLLLADRVTGLDAEMMSMKLGTIWTETDVTADAWYLQAGHIPPGVMIEAGQADLLLISYLGVDTHNRGERLYRLLGCTLTYHGGLPQVGDTLAFDIHLDGHAKQGETRLMFFHYDCHVDGELRLAVRGGQAGFFTDQELADSAGCLWRPEDQEIVDSPRLDPPIELTLHSTLSPTQLQAFAQGRPWACFGPDDGTRSAWDRTRAHTRSPRTGDGRMQFLGEVERFEARGGPWERGYLSAVTEASPDDWFFEGHFLNDPCMPGTLMLEGCMQAMALFLGAMGTTIDRDGWRFEPVQGEPFALTCRGQVTPQAKRLRYEIFVEEFVAGPVPTVYADVLCTVDGLKAFHGRRIGLRLVPAWPLDDGHALLDGYGGEAGPVASIDGFALDFPAMLACAQGRPSTAFGSRYARFDGPESVARLPNPPYHFISRVLSVDGPMGEMRPGMSVEVEYDVPAEAWYFAENGCRTMPLAVLMEVALQPCGWLASYMGCALVSRDSLKFRNLDGTGTAHAEIREDAKAVRTRVVNTRLSTTASMIIVGFEVECRVGDTLVYEMSTVFGFFPAAAFEDQAGLPTTPEQRALLELDSDGVARPIDPAQPGRPRLAAPMLMMLDRVTHFDAHGGSAGLGCARAEKDVDPGEWFFAAHFFQDPVQPGSLGVEAMLSLLQWCMRELGLHDGIEQPRFEPLALGQPLTWKYRGQVVPTNRTISTTLEITECGRDERGAHAIAEASLWVDGKRIYQTTGMGMRIVSGGAQHGRRHPLSLARQPWLRDHCPTWTIPAVPMMSMVDRLASAARADERVVGLRDVRIKGWLVVPPNSEHTLVVQRQGALVQLAVPEGDALREVATGQLQLGHFGVRPSAWPPLSGPQIASPYADGTLFHGPAFQLMENLVRTEQGASSTVRVDGPVPIGRLAPAVLDAAIHGIPHDALQQWDPRIPDDRVAYPAWIRELDVYGPTPTTGTLRCEVRYRGTVASVEFPSFEIQLIGDDGVWCRMLLVETCFPKGKLGSTDPQQRRAFLRDHVAAPGLSLSRTVGATTRMRAADVADSDWLPGTMAATYGTADPEAVARAEHIARAHEIHPAAVSQALPLTTWSLTTTTEDEEIVVRGDGWGRLDVAPVQAFWSEWLGREGSLFEDLCYGLLQRFVRRVVVSSPAAFAAHRGRPVVYLSNHQVAVESLAFTVMASALGELPVMTLAKAEHRNTWMGRFIDHCAAFPGFRDPGLIAFFDRGDPSSLPGVLQRLGARMQDEGRSMMVHVEGTRSLDCAHPVQAISGAMIDLALSIDAAVVPVRFVGGLPREPLETRLEFPLEMGQQDIFIGRPLLPQALATQTYGERRQAVVDAINALGPGHEHEQPLPGNLAFERAVMRRKAEHGTDTARATLVEVLAEQAQPCAATRALLDAEDIRSLAGDESEQGRWLHELATWLLG